MADEDVAALLMSMPHDNGYIAGHLIQPLGNLALLLVD